MRIKAFESTSQKKCGSKRSRLVKLNQAKSNQKFGGEGASTIGSLDYIPPLNTFTRVKLHDKNFSSTALPQKKIPVRHRKAEYLESVHRAQEWIVSHQQ